MKENLHVFIDSFKEKYSKDFEYLNLQWINEYFEIEEEDIKILGNPQRYVLKQGGEIFFALEDDKVVGTAAMVHVKDKVFELSKMAVDINYQGLGIGRKLINRCIDFAKNKGTKEVFLITNDKLAPALGLYKSSGFELDEDYDDNRYERGNTKMKLLLK